MANAIPILTYHSLQTGPGDYASDDHLALRVDLETIARLGFRIAPLPDVARYVTGTGAQWLADGRWVGLSFDDGVDWDYFDLDDDDSGYMKSFYTILTEHFRHRSVRLPLAVSFVIASPRARRFLDANYIVGMHNWQDGWWRAAQDAGVVAIGNHSWDHAHPGLPAIAQRQQRKGSFHGIDTRIDADRQIRNAEYYIRSRAGSSAGLFAYPYGEAPDYLVQEYLPRFGDDIGIVAAFTTGSDFATADTAPWKIPRFVHGDDWKSPDELVHILRNAHGSTPIKARDPSIGPPFATDAAPAPGAAEMGNADPPPAPVVVRERKRDDRVVRHSVSPDSADATRSIPAEGLVCFEEVTDPEFFVGDLFRRHFHAPLPSYPSHFVAFCRTSATAISVIGYVHVLARDDMKLCGGIIVDELGRRALPLECRQATRGPEGVMDFLLRGVVRRCSDAAAIWSYVGDPLIEGSMLRAGFTNTPHVHLMVAWNPKLTEDERATRLAVVAALGPF